MIGPACDSDLPAVLRLAGRMWDEAPAYRGLHLDMDRVAAVAYGRARDGMLLVATAPADGATVGFVAFNVIVDDWTGLKRAYEVALYVEPGYRGLGLAGQLVAAAEAHARDRGALWFTAGSTLGCVDDGSVSVYVRAGFTETGRAYRKSLAAVAAPS